MAKRPRATKKPIKEKKKKLPPIPKGLNPGSDAAIAAGCICPVLDNCHGRGAYNYPKSFYITAGCDVHDPN